MSYTLEIMRVIADDRHDAEAQVRHLVAATGRYVSFVHGVWYGRWCRPMRAR